MDAVTVRIGRIKELRMAWRYGGTLERQFVFLVVIAPIVAIATFVFSNTYSFFAGLTNRAVFQVNLVILMAAFSWPFFQPGISGPMYSNAYFQEAIREHWLSPLQCEYAAEIIRYREAMGAKELRVVRWARALAIFYDASVCGSVGALLVSIFTCPTEARALVISVSVDFSKFAAPETVLTRFGMRSLRR